MTKKFGSLDFISYLCNMEELTDEQKMWYYYQEEQINNNN